MQPCEGSQSGTGGPQTGAVVPMFPLPGVFLFPGTLMPLHIFEPRYRRMIEDSLDGPGRIVMATVLEGHEDELPGAPPVHHIAGLGEIMRHERLPDGRFLILLAGVSRVLIREIPSRAPDRHAEAIPLREVPPSSSRESELRTRIRRFAAERGIDEEQAARELPRSMGVARFGEPEAIARAVAFLASPRSAHTQGTILDVDGGQTRTL